MAYLITVNVDRPPSGAIVVSRSNYERPANLPQLVLGDERDYRIEFIDGTGAFESFSGSATHSLRVGLGTPGGTPTGGTFKLTAGSATIASPLSYGVTAGDLQTALNALNAGAGPFADTVSVVKATDSLYFVEWDNNGAQSLMTANASALDPASGITISRETTGDASTREKQSIRFARQPIVLDATWTPSGDGWDGNISTNNARLVRALAGRESLSMKLEIEVTDPSGKRRTYTQAPVQVLNEVVDESSLDPDSLPSVLYDSDAILNRIAFTGLTGGSATDLDSIKTVDLPLNLCVILGVTVGPSVPGRIWYLDAGTDAEDPAIGIVRPDDYADSINEKIWKVLL